MRFTAIAHPPPARSVIVVLVGLQRRGCRFQRIAVGRPVATRILVILDPALHHLLCVWVWDIRMLTPQPLPGLLVLVPLLPAELQMLPEGVDPVHALVHVLADTQRQLHDLRAHEGQNLTGLRVMLCVMNVGRPALVGRVHRQHLEQPALERDVLLPREVEEELVLLQVVVGGQALGQALEVRSLNTTRVRAYGAAAVPVGPEALHLLHFVESIHSGVPDQTGRLDEGGDARQCPLRQVDRVRGEPLHGVLHKRELPVGSGKEYHVADREAAGLVDEHGIRSAAAMDRGELEGVAKSSQVEHPLKLLQQEPAWHWEGALVHEPGRQARAHKILASGDEEYLQRASVAAGPHVLHGKGPVADYSDAAS
mmetsp:Transcript_54893/g.163410  ORF Transcript_54893/g.163410 Transcript_54893/m.163410 type:complete len:367 (-) Transcript_54893:1092-2192(-)